MSNPGERVATDSPREKARELGARLQAVLMRLIAAIVVLVVFVGLFVLVREGQLDGGALLLYAGVIIGYLLHATKQGIG